jgi:hypothetical protein
MTWTSRLPALLAAAGAAAAACAPAPRMCGSEADCGAQASCVAGRCVAHGARPAIDTARRLLFVPVDVAYLRRTAPGGDATIATLGRAGDEHATVLLRFAAKLPPEATVLEAYVVLERAGAVDADPAPVALHAARVVEAWEGRSVSWATQPRIVEVGAPVTRAMPSAGALVRLDVRSLVERWRTHEHGDFGVAVVSEGASPTGIAFVVRPTTSARAPADPVLAAAGPRAQAAGPRLELYVK